VAEQVGQLRASSSWRSAPCARAGAVWIRPRHRLRPAGSAETCNAGRRRLPSGLKATFQDRSEKQPRRQHLPSGQVPRMTLTRRLVPVAVLVARPEPIGTEGDDRRLGLVGLLQRLPWPRPSATSLRWPVPDAPVERRPTTARRLPSGRWPNSTPQARIVGQGPLPPARCRRPRLDLAPRWTWNAGAARGAQARAVGLNAQARSDQCGTLRWLPSLRCTGFHKRIVWSENGRGKVVPSGLRRPFW